MATQRHIIGQRAESDLPRYAGIATFAMLPRIEEVEHADLAVVGIPFDAGSSFRPGARFGPAHIRAHSRQLHPYHQICPAMLSMEPSWNASLRISSNPRRWSSSSSERLGTGPVYVSVDIDVLDPAQAPGTGTPEVAGITTRELFAVLRQLAGLNIVGGDVVEVAPAYDDAGVTGLAAAHTAWELLTLVGMPTPGD